jgi:cytochrome c oxidase subunit 2
MSGASSFVHDVDLSLIIIIGISLFFLVSITAVMIYFVFRYSRKRNPKATNIEGNNTLEILWTAIPTILVLVMFAYGWTGYEPMRIVPKDAIRVKAHAQMWYWSFEYENGKISPTLVVPLNKPVRVDLMSKDVIHSLYIPAFRIKEDAVPGKNNYLWFKAQETGNYDLFCSEYCGDRHSYMMTKVEVIPEQDFNTWLTTAETSANEDPGLTLIKKNACITCHSLDGTRIVGPTFKGIYGRKETVISDGKERMITVDDEYLKRSLYEPNADVVKGFNQGLMISFQGKISDDDLQKIIEYFKTLQ